MLDRPAVIEHDQRPVTATLLRVGPLNHAAGPWPEPPEVHVVAHRLMLDPAVKGQGAFGFAPVRR